MKCCRSLVPMALAATFAFAGALSARADAVTKQQKIEELFKLIRIDKSLQQVASQQVTQAQSLMKTMFPGVKLSADEQKDIDAFLQKIMAITQDAVSWPKLEPQFVDVYAGTYSEEEIDGMLAFYRSPTGTAMIAKQPEIITKSQAISQAQLATVQPKLREAVMQFVQEMSAKHPH